MKGKIKFKLNVVIIMIAILSVSFIFAFTKNENKELENAGVSAAHSVRTIDGEEYSALLEQNVILSVERVSVDIDNLHNTANIADSTKFFGRTNDDGTTNDYNFYDIKENGKSKQVIADGSLVMLKNNLINGHYVNIYGGSDAIMISLGQYIYSESQVHPNGEVDDPVSAISAGGSDSVCSQITFLEVGIKFNGQDIKSSSNDSRYELREILSAQGNSPYYDFLFLIQQDGTEIEGHYQITYDFLKDGTEVQGSFEFFLACQSSYENTKTVNQQTYNAKPTLGWSSDKNFIEGVEKDNVVNYYEGKDGINNTSESGYVSTISYPTLTYDYTRYKLDFYHTLNGKKITYDVSFDKTTGKLNIASSEDMYSSSPEMVKYVQGDNTNLVTLVFTEIGFYQFDFKYIYIFNSMTGKVPSMDHLSVASKKLVIHGVDLNYSKQGADSAEFRKLQFASNLGTGVDFVVMNGVTEQNQDSFNNKDLGLLYSVDGAQYKITAEKDIRVGEVILNTNAEVKDKTEDTLQNNSVKFQYDGDDCTAQDVATRILEVSHSNFDDFAYEFLNTISYINTNQGSIWINANESISKIVDGTKSGNVVTGGSFYFYSKIEFDVDSLKKEGSYSSAIAFNNQTIFNDVGYYLVFIKLQVEKLQPTVGEDFYQIYAFKYTSDTIDITVKSLGEDGIADNSLNQDKTENRHDDKIISAGGYTKDNVWISWVEPTTFESKIKAYYYQQIVSTSAEPMTRDELLTLQENEIKNENNILGGNVTDGQYSKYLIKLERAGKSATYKMFTIDRQDISGVVTQLVRQTISKGIEKYSYAINSSNEKVVINNGITDSYATIFWNDKPSGAEITTTYSFTPIIKSESVDIELRNVGGEEWISTNYSLGKTQTGYSYTKNDDPLGVADYSVLSDQGIYIFTIVDDAGNGCKYVFTIDRTEGYIQTYDLKDPNGNTEVLDYLSAKYKLYAKSVGYNVGTHKSISLNQVEVDNELNQFLQNKSDFAYGGYKIFNDATYLNGLKGLYRSISNQNYLTVKNNTVYIYQGDIQKSASGVFKGKLENLDENGDIIKGSSILKTIYVVAENNKFTTECETPRDSKTYANIEINYDNSLGMIYYGNTDFNIDNIVELFNKDQIDGNGVVEKLSHRENIEETKGAKDKFFAFTFLYGNAPFEVSTIKYSYYKLDLNKYNDEGENPTYFYSLVDSDKTLYDKEDPLTVSGNGTRGFYLLNNNHDGTTKDGLYCITRTYKIVDGADYGLDSDEVKYYFIVDRNAIIDVTNNIGTNIKINMLENESSISGNDFTLISSTPEHLSIEEVEENYYIYLKTNKLPAVLDIPYSKYLVEYDKTNQLYNQSKWYDAGRLTVDIYFQDIYGQITNDCEPYHIFSGPSETGEEYKNQDVFFSVDIYDYLVSIDRKDLADKLCFDGENNQKWLCLKGVYIMIIKDNIFTTSNIPTQKIIGFEIIQEEYPEVDISLGFDSKELGTAECSRSSGEYNVITNKEYVQIVLPEYISTSKTAKIDSEYLYIKEEFNNQTKYEVTYESVNEYVLKNEDDAAGWSISSNTTAGTGRVILLKTRLTDENGNIISANLDKPLKYTIGIRYKIGDGQDFDKYNNCYYYYTSATSDSSDRNYYAYSTYTITIDRLAPTENVDSLVENDELVKKGFVEKDLFETNCYNPSIYYFTYQYKNYNYELQESLQDIYALKVESDTIIKGRNGDLNRMYYKVYDDQYISDLKLTLPVLDLGSLGTSLDVTSLDQDQELNYGYLFSGESSGIYIVYEVDRAENITQYVVVYNDGGPEFTLNFEYNPAAGGNAKSGFIGTNAPTSYNIFDIAFTDGKFDKDKIDITYENDYFFNLTVESNIQNWKTVSINTNFYDITKNTFANLIESLCEENQFGKFTFTLTDRSGNSYTTVIQRYDKENMKSLNAENLIVKRSDGSYYIDLDRANYEDDGIFYYATQIQIIVNNAGEYITSTYTCIVENGEYLYTDGRQYVYNVDCSKNTTYKLIVLDVFGNTSAVTFSTIAGKQYYILSSDSGFNYSTGQDGTIYTASNLELEFDTMFKLQEVRVNDVIVPQDKYAEHFTTGIYETEKMNYIRINAEEINGQIVKYYFLFADAQNVKDKDFNIIIDTKTNPISFTEISGKARSYDSYFNKDISDINELNKYIARSSIDKVMNLAWKIDVREECYQYSYALYQKLKDENGTIKQIDTTNMTSIEIVTKDDASGAYWFVISITDENGRLLGNKIYAFDVQPSNNKLVYVSKNNIAIERTTVFSSSEIEGIKFNEEKVNIVPTKERIDLYISNEELIVKTTRENIELTVFTSQLLKTESGTWILYLYVINTGRYLDFLAVMQVPKTEILIGRTYANVVGSSSSGMELTKEQSTVYANVGDEINITATKLYNFPDTPEGRFASKNAICINVSYDINDTQSFIENQVFESDVAGEGKYEIVGNGNYTLKFVDVAGNVHHFNQTERDYVNVYALREVVLSLDGKTPIENGYYNGRVELDVYASARYETASIKINAYRNNKEYPVSQNLPCVINDYGNFTLIVTAQYKTDDNVIHNLSKTVHFTILNENEAKTTMDLSNFSQYDVTKVINPNGEDVTDVFFTEIINKNQTGLMIAYDSIISNAEMFGVSSGKLRFVMTFRISDGIYPEFEHDVAFTLNNEIPKLNCTLEAGENTTKGFDITFNPGIIFEQVGEAYITINDEIVYEIKADSINDMISLARTFKEDGDGDYYVKLVTASGNVLQSFKVEIKEPLNTSAIIVIVVVSVVILTVVITIIVLRKKMRIR